MAVSVDPVSERAIFLPHDSHPLGLLNGSPVKLDPVWRRALQDIVDQQKQIAVLLNAVRAEVNAHHP